MSVIELDYAPRADQRRYHADTARFRVLVWHRRLGKTTGVINDLWRELIRAKTFMPAAAYVAPLRNQAARIAWPLVQHYGRQIPGVIFNKADLTAHLGDRRLFCLGSDNPDAIRGIGLDAAVMDETAQIDPYTWAQVVRPALADRKGRCTFIGTPKGRMNLFHDIWEQSAELEGWSRDIAPASKTGEIDQDELAALRREMSADEYAQEFECSFNAAITGSYYSKEMAAAEAEGRITTVRYDKRLPVYAAFDLGWADLTAAWFAQVAGNEVRLIGHRVWRHTSLADVIKDCDAMEFPLAQLLMPHDVEVTELGSGTSRLEVLYSLGCNVFVVPKMPVEDGIQAVRDMLPRCVFDREACGNGVEALVQYRTEYDAVLRVYGKKAVHDWASHPADAFRYLTTGLPMVLGKMTGRRSKPSYRQVI